MALIRKTVKKQNLNQVQVFVEDTNNTYFNLLDLPPVIPTGRSSILIDGSDTLKKETDILYELVDANGEPIYVNPIRNYLEGTSRRLTIEVYENAPAGLATLTLLGEINPDPNLNGGIEIPPEFQGVYNVRYQAQILLDPAAPNNEKIIFLRAPKISVSETLVKEVIPRVGEREVNIQVSGSLSGKRVPFGVQQFLNPWLIQPGNIELDFLDDTKPTGVLRNRKYEVKLKASVDGAVKNVNFDWGDGTTDTFNPQNINGTHTYTKAGTYTVRAVGNSPFGFGGKDDVTITVNPPATPSASMIISDGTINEASANETEYLTGSLDPIKDTNFTRARFRFSDRSIISASSDVSNNPDDNLDDTTFVWEFGDGRVLEVTGSAGRKVIHEYTGSGTYTVKHTVKNNYDAQNDVVSRTILVAPNPPVADFTISNSVVNADANFNVTSSATISSGAEIDNFYWYFDRARPTGSQFLNYAPNGIFGSALSGFWDGYSVGNSSVTRQSSVKYSGSHALAQAPNADEAYFGHYRGSSTANLAPATQSDGFTIDAYARCNSGNAFVSLMLFGLDENFETIGSLDDQFGNIVESPLTQVNSSGWTRLQVHSRFLHPSTKYASFRINAKQSSGKTVYWDGFELYKTTVTGSAVSASYQAAGNYNIEHWAIDSLGRKSNVAIKQVVNNASTPRPHFSVNNSEGTAPLTVRFTEDGEGSPTSRILKTGISDIEMSASSQTADITYTEPGSYTPRIEASFAGGTKTFIGAPIRVGQPVPNIDVVSGSSTVETGQEFTLVVSGSSNQVSSTPGQLKQISVAWGDGSSDLLTYPNGITLKGTDSSSADFTHTYTTAGSYKASIVATDAADIASVSSSLAVTVNASTAVVLNDTDIIIDDDTVSNTPTASLSFGNHTAITRANASHSAAYATEITAYTWSLNDSDGAELTRLGHGKNVDFIVDDSDIKSVGLQVGVHGVQSNKVYYQLNAVDTGGDAKENAVTQDDDNNYDDGQSQDSNSDRNASNSGQNSDNDGTYDTSGDDRYDEQQNAGSPIVQDYEITLDSLSGNRKVGNSIYGAKVKVDRYELLDFAKGAGYTVTDLISQNLPYEFDIADIQNGKIIPSAKPLVFNNTVADLSKKLIEIPDLASSPYTMSFNETQEYDFNEVNFISKTNIRLSNLRTVSGDVYRAKVYYKTRNDSEYKFLTERVLEAREELVDKLHLKGRLMKGFFPTSSIFTSYWSGSQGTEAGYIGGNERGLLIEMTGSTASVSDITDSILISGSNYSEKDNVALWLKDTSTRNVATKGNVSAENRPLIFGGQEYSLRFNAKPIKAPKQVRENDSLVERQKAELKVYVSGSGLNLTNKGADFKSTPWGYLIGIVNPDDKGPDANITFPKSVYQNFILEDTARATLQFVATAGRWYINNVSLRQARESGFNPNNMDIITDTPELTQRPQKITYKVEYFTKDGKQADLVTYTPNSTDIQGSNTVFSGDDNVMPGTLTINNGLGEGQGFELSGQSSAYFRTKSYKGFEKATTGEGPPGIIMFSGSVGESIDSAETYDGLGLELHAGGDEGSLKFRSNPSVFEVKAKSFFLGSDSQFVSGSGGNIEISSSNFHLSSSGDVAVKGNIKAETGEIGGFTIGREKLSGETFYLRGNADETSTTDTGIFISSSNFQVRASGELSASAGNIAGWNIGGATLESDNIIFSSTGSIRTKDYVPKQKGWAIDDIGFAEFSNVFVRGTLATTTFEKQTVNAVGGRLLVSNATTISGSVGASATAIPVQNAAGFRPGELLFCKKVDDTGFNSEFLKLTAAFSASDQTGNSTGFEHALSASRAAAGSVTGSIGNFSGESSLSASYEDGQVIISFGRPGTGFIDINANPTDTDTPYIDIVESGSGGFSRKARLGDLSGLAGTGAVFGAANPGFGLMSENVFLSGRVSATEGNIGSWNITNTGLITGSNITLDANSSRIFKTDDNSELEGFYIDFTPGSNYYVRFGTDFAVSSSGQLIASGAKIEGVLTSSLGLIGGWNIGSSTLTGGDVTLSSDGSVKAGTLANASTVATTNKGFFASGSGDVLIKGDDNNTNYIKFDADGGNGALEIKTGNFSVDSSGDVSISGDVTATTGTIGGWTIHSDKIFTGTDENTTNYTSGAGRLILSSSGALHAKEFFIDKDGNASFKGDIQIGSGESVFKADSNGIYLGNETFGSAEFRVTPAGVVTATAATITGAVTATSGQIGGFTIDSTTLSGSSIAVSSSNGGSIKLGDAVSAPYVNGSTSVTGSDGIFLSGSGDFSFEKGISYIRGTSDGLAMNFPSFSINTAGDVTAQNANIAGNIEATTGFFGSADTTGWIIDGNKIRDANSEIEIDATAGSPNITITSGSFIGELVPNFTPSATILQAGGKSSSHTGMSDNTPSGNRTQATGLTLNNAQTSTDLFLYAGDSGSGDNTTFSAEINANSSSVDLKTLSAGSTYKSAATLKIEVTVATPNHDSLDYNIGLSGNYTISGSLKLLRKQGSTYTEVNHANIGQTVYPAGGGSSDSTTFTTTKNVTVNHTGAAEGYYFELHDLNVTNNALTENYANLNPFKEFSSDTHIESVKAYFTSVKHEPSNKKTELAPSGFQTIALENVTLNHSDNAYFRAAPEEDKTVEILGSTHLTGSLIVSDFSNTKGFIRLQDNATAGPPLRFGSTPSIAAANGIFLQESTGVSQQPQGLIINGHGSVAGVELFAFGRDGHLHVKDDVTAFSTSVGSDRRLKENIKPLENNLEKILELKPSSFRWKINQKKNDVGLIAQEVEPILPEVVKEVHSLGDEVVNLTGEIHHKTIDYSKLTTFLIGAIQEQQKQIDELKKKLEEL